MMPTIHAIFKAKSAMPPSPRTAAMIAMMMSVMASCSMALVVLVVVGGGRNNRQPGNTSQTPCQLFGSKHKKLNKKRFVNLIAVKNRTKMEMFMRSARFNYWDHAYRIGAFRLISAFDAFSEMNFRSLIALGFQYGNWSWEVFMGVPDSWD